MSEFDFDITTLPNPHLRGPREHPYRSKEDIIRALVKNRGFVSHAAKELKMSCAGLSARLNRPQNKKEFDEIRKMIKEANLDLTEKKFFSKIDEGDVQCILYHLKTHGKSRGYGNDVKQEIDQNLNWKIEIVHKVDEDDKAIECSSKMIEEYAEYSDTTEV